MISQALSTLTHGDSNVLTFSSSPSNSSPPLSHNLSEEGKRVSQKWSGSQEAQAWGPACSASAIWKVYRYSSSSVLGRLLKKQAGHHDSHWADNKLCYKRQVSRGNVTSARTGVWAHRVRALYDGVWVSLTVLRCHSVLSLRVLPPPLI